MNMESKTSGILIPIIAILVILGGYSVLSSRNSSNNTSTGGSNNGSETKANLDGFAQCLKDKGAVFYGAFWCPHCQREKELFGESEKLIPYVECSAPDRSQLDVCKEKNIDGYPTWVFADGSREKGEVSLEKLAEKTGCQISTGNQASPSPTQVIPSPQASPSSTNVK